jgi:hypothetical protein
MIMQESVLWHWFVHDHRDPPGTHQCTFMAEKRMFSSSSVPSAAARDLAAASPLASSRGVRRIDYFSGEDGSS